MCAKKICNFGTWSSPLKADFAASGQIRIGQVEIDSKKVYWCESRPDEGGRNTIVSRSPGGKVVDVLPLCYNVRSRVHEYGGGSFTVKDRIIVFSNFEDQRLYIKMPGEEVNPLTGNDRSYYADLRIDPRRKRVLCVREDHGVSGDEPVNSIAIVRFEGSRKIRTLIQGNDFYASPRLSPDGKKLAYLTWNHPDMPWDGSELWVAQINKDGSVGKKKKIAGGRKESIFQPEWSPDNLLYFVSDKNNWWNLYRAKNYSVESLFPMEADFGVPQWVFGLSTYDFISENKIACSYVRRGQWHLAVLNLSSGELSPLETKFTDISFLKVMGEKILMSAASATEPPSVVSLDLNSKKNEVLRSSVEKAFPSGYISVPERVSFLSEEGEEVYGFYYAPTNKGFKGPKKKKPPLIVITHGGPTSAASISFDLKKQFWTSRGFAILDVNYRGSSGYGREYREGLEGKWGVRDVDDCINGARYLINKGKVDGNRLIIRGGSAGGYTTLCALTFRDFFGAGASYYGVSDLIKLTEETHKFESHYLDSLIGEYPGKKKLYKKRSPIISADSLSVPVIFFQGLKDKVVPPEQSEVFASVLERKGIPVAYIAFEEEQHGFRKKENIKCSLEAELYFYSRIFGFELKEDVRPVEIKNLGK